jgi:hypothetical protein
MSEGLAQYKKLALISGFIFAIVISIYVYPESFLSIILDHLTGVCILAIVVIAIGIFIPQILSATKQYLRSLVYFTIAFIAGVLLMAIIV